MLKISNKTNNSKGWHWDEQNLPIALEIKNSFMCNRQEVTRNKDTYVSVTCIASFHIL